MNQPSYRVGRLISGEGGQADIYEITRIVDGERFAGKFPKPHFANDFETLRRFTREAEHYHRLHALVTHPHVARMIEIIDWKGQRGILLELMQGSLERRLEAGMPDALKVRAIREAALGLAHLHQHGIAHRDVKPSNILIAHDGRTVVSDLGCATIAGATAFDLTKASIGTPSLMAPEQHGPLHYADALSDVYGLGTCIALAFLGQYPEQSDTEDGQKTQVRLSDKLTELDPAFQDLLWRCLHPDRGQRFSSMDEFLKAWDDLARQGLLKTPATFLEKVGKVAVFAGLVLAVVAAVRSK